MKTKVFRTAMCGGGLSYDVYVPVSEVPEQQKPDLNGNTHTTIVRGHDLDNEYYNFPDATVPAEQRAMEQGWERYEAWNRHEKRARQIMLKIAQKAFPELNRFGDTLPTLWVNDLMKVETSSEKWIDYDPITGAINAMEEQAVATQ